MFGLYFTEGLLQAAKWPRKQGIFGKEVIDTRVLDSVVDQMVDWGAAIGAGRPKLALEILAYLLDDKDWDGPDAPRIIEFIDNLEKQKKDTKKSPHEILPPGSFAEAIGPFITLSQLEMPVTENALEQYFISSLIYGLGRKSEYESWYKEFLKVSEKDMPLFKEVGLEIGELQTLEETYSNGEEIVRNCAEAMGIKFPAIPAKLKNDAKSLGVKV